MTTALLLFLATFVVVFALVFQSLNVNGGHRLLACLTSFAISASNLVLFKVLPGDTQPLQIAAYLLGGPSGVLAAMAAHPIVVRTLARWRAARQARAAWFTLDAAGVVAQRAAPVESPPLNERAAQLARRLLDPEDLGHLANAEIRDAARRALGLPGREARP